MTGEPLACSPQAALPNPKFSIAYMPARVTTARLTPLTRSEATAVMKPTISAQPMPTSGASGKSAHTPPTLVSMCDIAYPVTPARPTWTTEICPTKPTTTTSDRQIIAPSIELTIACRNSYGRMMSSTTPATRPITENRTRRSGRGASGMRFSVISPRAGTFEPRQNMATATRTKNSSSGRPLSGLPWDCGNQLCEAQ